MKERHIRLRLSQSTAGGQQSSYSALGWNWAERVAAMELQKDSVIDIAYKLRHNEHPEYGGLELEIVDLRPASLP
jgi:single-stranded-DNA-specific exonuclease